MKKSVFILGLISVLFSCENSIDSAKKNLEKKINKYFFNFDELTHYRIEIEENSLLEIEDKKNISPEEQLQLDLILFEKPNSIEDTSFIMKLKNIGFKKKKIDENQFEDIKEIFKEKEVKEVVAYACTPVFRDILIFRKNNKTIGITKICFDCNQNKFYGTHSSTINFGQKGDYGKLNRILNI